MLISRVHQELQTIILLLKILQQNNLRLLERLCHIMNLKSLEVTADDPSSLLGQWKIVVISSCLVIWGKAGSTGLKLRLRQVNRTAFLLDQYLCLRNIYINITSRVFKLDTLLKQKMFCRIFYTEYFLEQIHPESLRVLLLITFTDPRLHKV